jgi:hypothetical protein
MKIYHTITCTKYDPDAKAHREFTRHLTRNRKLTHNGIQRMFARGCDKYEADADVCVTRVETAISV